MSRSAFPGRDLTAFRRRRRITLALSATLAVLAIPATALGYGTASGFSAGDYATGFEGSPSDTVGPTGVAFDRSDNLYVGDFHNGNIYRFPPGGGQASPATKLNSDQIPGLLGGLAFTSAGNLYLARYQPGDVVQIDPQTGTIIRTVATVACASGLAVDPASGDLFVSQNQCGSTIYRISLAGGGATTATPYAHLAGVDGMAFDQSGTLYAEADGSIVELSGTNSASPGSMKAVAWVPHGDGVAFGAHASGQPPFLVVNGNDGAVTKVDFTQSPVSEQQIFTGGSRGDFAAVDSLGCLYITQSSSIVRISSTGSQCAFEPTTPGAGSPPPPAVVLTQVSGSTAPGAAGGTTGPKTGGHKVTKPVGGKSCLKSRTLTFRISQQGGVRLRSATVYVNGRSVKVLRGAAVEAPFAISKLPGGAFDLKVVAVTTKGKRLVTRKRYPSACQVKPPPCLRAAAVKFSIPRRRGTDTTSATIFVNGRRRQVVSGHKLTSVRVPIRPGTSIIRILVRYADGAQWTLQRTLTGCAKPPRSPGSAKRTATGRR